MNISDEKAETDRMATEMENENNRLLREIDREIFEKVNAISLSEAQKVGVAIALVTSLYATLVERVRKNNREPEALLLMQLFKDNVAVRLSEVARLAGEDLS